MKISNELIKAEFTGYALGTGAHNGNAEDAQTIVECLEKQIVPFEVTEVKMEDAFAVFQVAVLSTIPKDDKAMMLN